MSVYIKRTDFHFKYNRDCEIYCSYSTNWYSPGIRTQHIDTRMIKVQKYTTATGQIMEMPTPEFRNMKASDKYKYKNLPRLKEMLRKRHLPIGGNKNELVDRLKLSDLNVSELKIKLKKEGLSVNGSKPDLVKRLLKVRGKRTKNCDQIEVPVTTMAVKPAGNPWKVPLLMKCGGCGQSVPNSDKLSHLDSCWFTNDGPSDVYLLHARSVNWAEKFELYLAVPLNGSFEDIDLLLQFTWMQCCFGHARSLDIYAANVFTNLKDTDDDPDPVMTLTSTYGLMVDDDIGPMDTALRQYLQNGVRMMYEYGGDYNTSIFVDYIGERRLKRPLQEEKAHAKTIRPVMRNEMLVMPCEHCYKKSTMFFMDDSPYDSDESDEDSFNEDGDDDCGMKFFCSKACSIFQGHRRRVLKPFLNSPRSGICNYKGKTYL
ncbi:uncharacterized protein LOC102800868 [Saccoglossus kowalevskii]|uniref:SAP domain protein-like protein 224 n=1 Tax=Saccoglossus kowalevskii TaxID=10224 RepID=A0A1L7H7F8_SACKO|nr:SAP domain protein-like protein 224 [Saccoglossus kowalevskii]